jgi:hypothetical protein
MTVVQGPCFSLSARGTLNDTITFAKIGRTAYTKAYCTPRNPKSAGQTGIRAMVKFLTKLWSSLSTANKTNFQQLADDYNLSLYHAFLKFNLNRWTNHLPPISDLLSSYKPTGTNIIMGHIVNDKLHTFSHGIIGESGTVLGSEFHVSTIPGFTPTRSTCVIVSDNTSYEPPFWYIRTIWTSPDYQTYYVKARYFLTSGNPHLLFYSE